MATSTVAGGSGLNERRLARASQAAKAAKARQAEWPARRAFAGPKRPARATHAAPRGFAGALVRPIESSCLVGPRAKRELYFSAVPLSPAAGPTNRPSPRGSLVQGKHVKFNQLSEHLQVDRYGDFWLTDAIRPSLERQVVPCEGYRIEMYRDAQARIAVPVLAAAVSRERLFDLFLELLDPLGEVVDAVLETSHDTDGNAHRDLFREDIDLPVLKSHLCDAEHLLLHDGCTGVAVISKTEPIEVQFDEHKLLIIYARDLKPFEQILRSAGLERDDHLKLITEGEHLHSTDPRFISAFEQLCYRLGVGEAAEHVNW
jgi:hypothetical protein